MLSRDHVYTLKELSLIIEGTCDELFGNLFFRCKAEVGSFKIYGNRVYIDLVQSSSDGKIIEKITGIVWNKRVFDTFLANTGYSEQEILGQQVLVEAGIKGSVKYGFSCTIHSFSQEFTEGKQALHKKNTREALKKKGIFSLNKTQKLGDLPYGLAIISSEQSAGLKDFKEVILESGFDIKTTLYPSRVHGNDAIDSILNTLTDIRTFLEQGGEYSAVCIVRGGGGKEGFAWQNNEKLLEAICTFPVPICSAVGHAEDTSLLDEVVFHCAKTPTDIAYYFVAGYNRRLEHINALRQSITMRIEHKRAVVLQQYPLLYSQIQAAIDQRLKTMRRNIDLWHAVIKANNPENNLQKGYYILKDLSGEYVDATAVSTAQSGTQYLLCFNAGSRVITIE